MIRAALAFLCLPSLAIAQPEKIAAENEKAAVVINVFDRKGTASAQGSGFIVRADGAIVTNLHVIGLPDRVTAEVRVTLASGSTHRVEGVFFKDEQNDLALLKISARDLPTVKLGDSDSIKKGEKIVVIGSPKGFSNSVSEGIISGLNREIELPGRTMKVFQHTAPISPGSSGGAVFNAQGEVIGVVVATHTGGQNLNFAIPINLVRGHVNDRDAVTIEEALGRRQPESAEYWTDRAVWYLNWDLYDMAARCCTKALEIQPGHAHALALRAQALYSKQDWDGALRDAEKALESSPAHTTALILRAQLRIRKEDYDAALTDTERALHPPKGSFLAGHEGPTLHSVAALAYCGKGDYQRAVAEYREALTSDLFTPVGRAHLHVECGLAFAKSGSYAGAIEHWKEAVTLAPCYSPEPRLVKMMNLEGAIADCTRALKTDPKNAAAYYARGVARYLKGEVGATADCIRANQLDRSLGEHEEDAEGLVARGLNRYFCGDYAAAVADWEQVLEHSPSRKTRLQDLLQFAQERLRK